MTAYYVNVADWNPEQVAEWVRGNWYLIFYFLQYLSNIIFAGLDDTLIPYIRHIMEQEINGLRLLSTTVEDLPVLKVIKLGHQEIFMGAIDLLRDFVSNTYQLTVTPTYFVCYLLFFVYVEISTITWIVKTCNSLQCSLVARPEACIMSFVSFLIQVIENQNKLPHQHWLLLLISLTE